MTHLHGIKVTIVIETNKGNREYELTMVEGESTTEFNERVVETIEEGVPT